MANPSAATLDFASLLSDNPRPARVTILDPKEAYNPDTKKEKKSLKIKSLMQQQQYKQPDPTDLEATELVRKLVAKTPTYASIVEQDLEDDLEDEDDAYDEVTEMVRAWPKRQLQQDWKVLSPSFHEVTMGNWEDQIQWEGAVEDKSDGNTKKDDTAAARIDLLEEQEAGTAKALLAQPRNPDLDALVFDDSNISWEGTRADNIEKASRIHLILELGIAGQSVARQALPSSRPLPFAESDAYMKRAYNWSSQAVTSTAEMGKSSLHINKEERKREIAQRQMKRAQMALDKKQRVLEAMGTVAMGGGQGRTITSSLMGPGGTERTGRPTRGNTASTATHDAEYIEQLDLVHNHVFSKPEMTLVEMRQYHRPKLPLNFVRRDRQWQFQIRYIPTPKKADTTANPNSYMSVHAGSTSQAKIRIEADLNPTEGNLVLLEYCEERPPIQVTKGMGSKIVNYFRGDKSRCPVSAGGGDRPMRRKRVDAKTTVKDTSGPSGKVERPPRLKGPNQVANASLEDWIGKIPKRKRQEDQGDRPSIDILPEGVTEILHPKVHGPFLGEVEEGVTQTGLINNVLVAPMFRHEPESTDFLMILGKRAIPASQRGGIVNKMSVVLRPMPSNIFTVGQVEPRDRGLVHAPQTSGEKNFLQNFVSYHVAKGLTLNERHSGMGLRFDELVAMWAGSGIQNTSLRQRIKVVADYDKNSQIWESKPISDYGDPPYPGVEALGRKLPPEGVATYETACAATRRMQDLGIHSLYVGSSAPVQAVAIAMAYLAGNAKVETARKLARKMKNAFEKVSAPKSIVSSSQVSMYQQASVKLDDIYKELRRKQEVARFIFEELCLAPWHWTFEFIDVHKHAHGPGQMKLIGTDSLEPSGVGEGFSFLRDTDKVKGSKQTVSVEDGLLKAAIKKITGTDNDLRKLTMKQMGQMLRSFGMPQTKIDSLKRWDRVHVIRDFSTKASSDGMGEGLQKFARGEKLKLSEQKQDYRQRIQAIWRRQRTTLSMDVGEMRPGGQPGEADIEEAVVPAEILPPTKAAKETVNTSDDDSDDDDFEDELMDNFMDDKTGNQIIASQRQGEDGGPLLASQRQTNQDDSKEARDLAAFLRQKDEDKAAQDGIGGIGMSAPVKKSMIGKKVVRKRITKTHSDGRTVTTFKFILSEAEVEKVRRKDDDNDVSHGRRRKQIHKQNDRTYGHAMFEDDDSYELAATEYPRVRSTKGRKGGLAKGPKSRKPMTSAGRMKAKMTDKRMKKRKKEMEEAELYVPPAKRKTSAHRRERGGGRQRLPHVVFSARLEKIRLDVERFPSSGPFVRPVDRRKFPIYYEKISDPIDLQTIRDKNQKFQYKLVDVFLRDFHLMKTNAEKFNGVNHPLAAEASRIYDQVKQTIDANRDELTKMEADLYEMNSGGKKKKKNAGKSSGANQAADSNMVDGINFGDVKFDDDSDSGDSVDFIVDQIG